MTAMGEAGMSSTDERDPHQAAGDTGEEARSDAERLLTRRRLLVKTALVSAPILMSIKGQPAWADGSAAASPTHASHQP